MLPILGRHYCPAGFGMMTASWVKTFAGRERLMRWRRAAAGVKRTIAAISGDDGLRAM